MTDQIPAARPVPTTEDRMRDARTDRSFATYLDATERDQLDARAATAEQERDDALDARDHWRRELNKLHEAYARATTEREQARAEAANLRQQLDRANTGRQKLQEQLDTQTAVAQGNKRHVAYLTAVIEAIANVEPHIHNGDTTEDNCSPYCPGCRIRTAMNATPPSSVPPRRAQEEPVDAHLGDPAGYEIVATRLYRDRRGQLVSGNVVVASAVSTRPTLAEAVDELRRAIGPDEREG